MEKNTQKITLYYVQLHGLGEKVWILCSKKDYESRKNHDADGVKFYEYDVITENSLFQLIKVNKNDDGISALLKVKGYLHVEWFDIYLQDGAYIVEQNQMINPTEYTETQWELIYELLNPLGEELESKSKNNK